ncbi:LuxR C-terminal-related transcriptional regulator [Dactylosporangium sp. CA-052675]|uniref:LuxR C-terminal-related transcriptional regulator n=1 Tax=Dactylosporangium sp. CA-052675 TaxID=3239927 RepID=UPI003D8B3670
MAKSPPWRILLADDHTVVRAGLRALLAADSRCEVVGEASSLGELRALAHNLRPDLIVLDLSFGAEHALSVVPGLLEPDEAPRIVVLTMHDDVATARQALTAGVQGYLIKESAADELLRAVETVMSGSTYLHPELGARMLRQPEPPADGLSPRERQVLALVARGHTNAEIAEQLLVSLRTVETHRANLRTRLNLHSRADLVDAARLFGLLP